MEEDADDEEGNSKRAVSPDTNHDRSEKGIINILDVDTDEEMPPTFNPATAATEVNQDDSDVEVIETKATVRRD